MSHLDDLDDLIPDGQPVNGLWAVIGVVFVVCLVVACLLLDHDSAQDCLDHGETYVDSRFGYTLCEDDGGVVHRR